MRCCFHTNRHIILSVAAKLTLTQWLCSLIKPWTNFGYNTALKILISPQIIWNDTHAMLHTIYVLVCIQWVKPCYAQNILGICFPSLIKTQTELFGEKIPVFTWVLLSDCTLLLLFCFQPLFLSLPFLFFVLFFCLFLFCFQPLFLSLPFLFFVLFFCLFLFCFQPLFLSLPFLFFVLFFCLFLFCFQPLFLSLPFLLFFLFFCLFLFCFQPLFLSLPFLFFCFVFLFVFVLLSTTFPLSSLSFFLFCFVFCFAFNLFLSLPFPSVLSQSLRSLIFC